MSYENDLDKIYDHAVSIIDNTDKQIESAYVTALENIEVEYQGERLEAGFNPRYFIDVFNRWRVSWLQWVLLTIRNLVY